MVCWCCCYAIRISLVISSLLYMAITETIILLLGQNLMGYPKVQIWNLYFFTHPCFFISEWIGRDKLHFSYDLNIFTSNCTFLHKQVNCLLISSVWMCLKTLQWLRIQESYFLWFSSTQLTTRWGCNKKMHLKTWKFSLILLFHCIYTSIKLPLMLSNY